MGFRVILLYLVVLLYLLEVVTCKKSICPCNPCECKKMQTCGGNFRNGRGSVQLPRTGANSCFRCEWILSVQRRQKVRMSFSQFHLGSGDWVKVYDGTNKKDTLIVKYDANSAPVEIVTSGNKLKLQFQSDKCGDPSRLMASFKAIECGGLIRLDPENKRNRKAVIQSPRFPRMYPSNCNCLWMVIGKDSILFARVSVQTVHTENNTDFVKIIESLHRTSSVRLYSGRLASTDRFTVANVPGVTVQFVSDKNIAEKGFKLTIEALSGVQTCQRPKRLTNGRFAIVDHKRTVYYYCCSGYRLVGSPRLTCNNGKWNSRSFPRCESLNSCITLHPPDNSHIVDDKKPAKIGSVIQFRCNTGFQLVGTSDEVVTATCQCTGQWDYEPVQPRCGAKTCGSPPLAPLPLGKRTLNSIPPYRQGAVVNYTCPDGYGLDGVPYRRCNRLGEWEPKTRRHTCRRNMNVCNDPGTPVNGNRRVLSFGDGHLAGFGCFEGYKAEGSQLRTCHASDSNNIYWSGMPMTCIDMFKQPFKLAAQWRENFIDRSVICLDEDVGFRSPTNKSLQEDFSGDSLPISDDSFPTVSPSTSRPETVSPTIIAKLNSNTSNNGTDTESPKGRGGACRGRAVTVGDGCLDLIYAIDCSKSINATSFNQSLEFVGSSVSLFDIDSGQANVALFTYDNEVYVQFQLGAISTTEETVRAIKSANYCAGSTATRPVLLRIEEEIIARSNESCRKAIFILTDGQNNWGGDPEDIADRIKEMPNVEIYTIAFGSNSLNWGVLRSLASRPDYFIPVRHPDDIRKAIIDAHDIKIDYSSQCGTTNSPGCRARVVNGCNSGKGAWPWMAAIYSNKDRGYNFLCGGTLIADCWVLTAAHCLPGQVPDNLIVVLGDTDRYVQEYTESSYEVEKISVHQSYNDKTFDNDIGLLKLKCSVGYKSQVRKGCLPYAGDEKYYYQGTTCIVAGWGHTKAVKGNKGKNPLPPSTVLKHVELRVEELETCRSKYAVTNNMICTSSNTKNEKTGDACQGDSGGPLFCKRTGDGSSTYVVIGIVSWGEGCAQQDKYGYFTHVQKKMDWIKNQMSGSECKHSYKDCPAPRKTLF